MGRKYQDTDARIDSEVSQSAHPYRLQFGHIRQILKAHRVGAAREILKKDADLYGRDFIQDITVEVARDLGAEIAEVSEPEISTAEHLSGQGMEIRFSGVFLSEKQCQDILQLLKQIEEAL